MKGRHAAPLFLVRASGPRYGCTAPEASTTERMPGRDGLAARPAGVDGLMAGAIHTARFDHAGAHNPRARRPGYRKDFSR